MIDDNEDDMYGDAIQSLSIIDKLDVLIHLIQNSSYEKQRSLLHLLEETKFHLLHAWNEAQYYRELCEGYETTINKAASGLK
jgi:hypothetical protein